MAVRIGIVGWGAIARRHAVHLRQAGALLAGIAARRRPSDLDVPWFESIEELLPHVDGVTIAVPNHLHAASCLAAVSAGRSVMVEKPLLISASELGDLEQVLPHADVAVSVGFRLRWNPILQELRRTMPSPHRIECSYALGIDELAAGKAWTRRHDRTGGAFFTLGVHMLDVARWLCRAEAEPLTAMSVHSDGLGADADYPLRAAVGGCLRGATLRASTDTCGKLPYRIDIRTWEHRGAEPIHIALDATHETVEYGALLHDFVEATAARRVDRPAVREYLQTHRELLQARELASLPDSEHTRQSGELTS